MGSRSAMTLPQSSTGSVPSHRVVRPASSVRLTTAWYTVPWHRPEKRMLAIAVHSVGSRMPPCADGCTSSSRPATSRRAPGRRHSASPAAGMSFATKSASRSARRYRLATTPRLTSSPDTITDRAVATSSAGPGSGTLSESVIAATSVTSAPFVLPCTHRTCSIALPPRPSTTSTYPARGSVHNPVQRAPSPRSTDAVCTPHCGSPSCTVSEVERAALYGSTPRP